MHSNVDLQISKTSRVCLVQLTFSKRALIFQSISATFEWSGYAKTYCIANLLEYDKPALLQSIVSVKILILVIKMVVPRFRILRNIPH